MKIHPLVESLFLEWRVRVYNGMPDPSDAGHTKILRDICLESGLNAEDVNKIIPAVESVYRKLNEEDLVKNKETGNVYTVKNVNKDKHTLIKKDASKDDIEKAKKADDSESETQSQQLSDKDKKAVIDKQKEVDTAVNNVVDKTVQADEETKEKIKNLMTKAIGNEKLSEEEANFLSDWVRVVEPTEATESSKPKFKLYVAYNKGDFRRTTGATRAEKVDMKQSLSAKIVHSNLQKAGLITQRVSTFGGKKSAPNQLYSTDGKVNIIEKPKPVLGVDETDEIRKAKDIIKNAPKSLKKGSEQWNELKEARKKVSEWARKAKSVQVGDLKIEKQDLSQYEKGSVAYKKAARNNREMAEFAEKIALGEMEFIDMDEGVYPDSAENRVTVIQSAIGNMINKFNELAEKPVAPGIPAAPLNEEATDILNRLESISKADPNGNGDPFDTPQEWMDAFEEVMSEFANNDPLKEGWANFAEIYTSIRAMHANGRGTEFGKCALLPESSTLETVDVMEIGGGKGKGKYVTLDGVSVKKGKGGASALTSKVKKAVMKNDDDGSLRRAIIDITRSHTDIYRDDVNHEKYRQKVINVAKRAGVAEEEINEVVESSKTSKKVSSALKTIMKNRMKDAPKNKKSPEYAEFIENEKKMEEVMRDRLESYYIYTYLSHLAYNEAVLAQDFDNESVLSQKADKGGSALVREKRIKIDSSNGIDVLAYARPTFDVGFTNDGRSKNPGSGRLENKSEKPGWDFYRTVL